MEGGGGVPQDWAPNLGPVSYRHHASVDAFRQIQNRVERSSF